MRFTMQNIDLKNNLEVSINEKEWPITSIWVTSTSESNKSAQSELLASNANEAGKNAVNKTETLVT